MEHFVCPYVYIVGRTQMNSPVSVYRNFYYILLSTKYSEQNQKFHQAFACCMMESMSSVHALQAL